MAKKRGKEPDPLTIDEVDAFRLKQQWLVLFLGEIRTRWKANSISKEEAERIYSDPGFCLDS